MRRTPLYMALYAATLLLLGGCRKDLCYDHPDHAFSVQVNLTATWEQEWERSYQTDWQCVWNPAWPQRYDDLRPDVPTGIRARIYTGGTAENEGNLSPEGGRLYMNEGTHDLLFYNNDTEYIVFNDIAALASASATTRSLTRGAFEALHAGERTVNQPDMLYGAYIGSYEALPTQETVGLPVRLQPLTYTYLVRYEFQQGFQYVALARGALAGMAESVYLNDGHTGPEAATVMFDCTLRDYGPEATVKSFGIPDYPGDHYGDGTRTTVAAHGSLNSRELADLRATDTVLRPVAEATGGGIFWMKDGLPAIRRPLASARAAGDGWLGLVNRNESEVSALRETPLMPGLILLIGALGGLIWAWWREGRA